MDAAGSDKSPVRVTIFNQSYTLLAAEDPSEVLEIAHLVDELMMNIASKAGNVDATRAAVLTCLHLADRLRTLERDLAGLHQRVDAKSKHFSLLLDRVIDR